MIDSRVQTAAFDAGRQLARLAELGKCAVASVVGIVEAEESVVGLTVEAYPAMAKTELGRIAEEAAEHWPLAGLILIHRHGRLSPGDPLLFCGVAASDPVTAQAACGFLVDAVRRRGPFWRQEELADGTRRWWTGSDLPKQT